MPLIPRTEADYDVVLAYRVLFEDDWFMAVEKPAPLPRIANSRELISASTFFIVRVTCISKLMP